MGIPFYTNTLPWLKTTQMIEVDRAMIEEYHIELVQMMENAGRNLARLASERFLDGKPQDKHVTVLAGTGGNGGGALVAARRLHTWGAKVNVFVTRSAEDVTPVPKHQLEIIGRLGINVTVADMQPRLEKCDVILDGIIGYSLKGAPKDNAAKLIEWANAQDAPILALDAPSGLDTTTGTIFNPAIKATATMTLALPKAGLRAEGVAAYTGELYLADISVPPELYASPALRLQVGTIFAESEIVRLS